MESIKQLTLNALATAMVIFVIVLLCWIMFQVGKQKGVEIGIELGRQEYQDELIKEFDAKNGAPILLYGPDKREVD